MPTVVEDSIRPFGWEEFPKEQRFKLNTLDYLSTPVYVPHLFFFRLPDDKRDYAAKIFRKGLERAVGQIPTFVGTIEKDPEGNHSIVVKRDSSARYVTQHLDGPDDSYPSMDELEKGHFLAPVIGPPALVSNWPMVVANIPEAHPDNSPPLASVKINYIRGGLIIVVAMHHYWNSVTGNIAFFKLLTASCRHEADCGMTPLPFFDPACLDRTLIDKFALAQLPAPPPDKTELRTAAPRDPGRNKTFRPSCSVMFHLPKSKGAQLKKFAEPEDKSAWISTYDAACALLWRVTTRLREPVYKPSPDSSPIWAHGVSFLRVFKDPPLPEQLQGNLHLDVNSTMSEYPSLTLDEVTGRGGSSGATTPLSKLALYTRHMTDGVTPELLAAELGRHRDVRNKADLSINVDMYPPLSNLASDWRSGDYCRWDFGFGKPLSWRVLMGKVALSQVCVYAPRRQGPAGDDEGMEVLMTVEKEILQELIDDPDWSRFFEYRGLDAWEGDMPVVRPARAAAAAVRSML